MSATIIALPTAASAPVVQPRRRGRFPKSIRTLASFRFEQMQKRAVLAKENLESMTALVHETYCRVHRGELSGLAVVETRSNGPDMGRAAGSFVEDQAHLKRALSSWARMTTPCV